MKYIKWFKELGIKDVDEVVKNNYKLDEYMLQLAKPLMGV